jgi:hypothetical protein
LIFKTNLESLIETVNGGDVDCVDDKLSEVSLLCGTRQLKNSPEGND